MKIEYIDTRTQDSLKQGVMEFLNLTEDKMEQIFEAIYHNNEKNSCEWVENFLACCSIDKTPKCIQMFHLSRRLNGADLCANSNLKQLLLEESPISLFFEKHNVTFKEGEGHIDMFYKGKLEPLDDEYKYSNGNMCYMRSRLGYNDDKDYCVNGFAFRSHLEECYYFRPLSKCPEFVQNIERLLNITGMVSDYYDNSTYYCIEYLVPLEEVIFDVKNPLRTARDKTIELLKWSIIRLYDDWRKSSFTGDENLRLRLSDSAIIKPEWFIGGEEV